MRVYIGTDGWLHDPRLPNYNDPCRVCGSITTHVAGCPDDYSTSIRPATDDEIAAHAVGVLFTISEDGAR